MKRYTLLCIAALACVVQTALAQGQELYRTKHSALPMPFADKLVKPASDYIVPAHIPDIKKPFVVSQQNNINSVRDFIKKTAAQCLSQKSPSPTIELNAQRINNSKADLKWQTKYAVKAAGFNIERSLADTFHFMTVNFAAVNPTGGTKKNYQAPDLNDYTGISFYRIKQFNRDTTYTYSNVVAVDGYNVPVFKIYPNPVFKNLTVEFRAQQSGKVTIDVHDLSGKVMQHYSLDCIKNIVVRKDLDVTAIVPGSYDVKIIMPDKTFLSGRFIKQ